MSQEGANGEEVVEQVSSKPQYYVTESGLPVGPKPDVEYPLTVLYCGNCGLPTEVNIQIKTGKMGVLFNEKHFVFTVL